MIKVIKDAPKNVAAFVASGEVTKEDFDIVFKHVQKLINQEGELNYLLKLKTDTSNFTVGAWLEDMLLGIKHLTKWNRCAIVSDKKTVHDVTALADKVTIGDFQAFSHKHYEEALNWVSTGSTEETESDSGNVRAALLAGLGGAIVLNAVHELVRHNFDNVPEVNKLGEEALDKMLSPAGVDLNDDELYNAALAGDLVSNALYYSTLATNKAGILSGIVGGIGAVILPKYIGLNDQPVASTDRKKLLTVAYYTLGALATGFIYKKLKK